MKVLLLLSFIVVIPGNVVSLDNSYNNQNNYDHKQYDTTVCSFNYLFTNSAIRFYQKYISPYKGGECFMHPHCSLYGQMAFKKYNPIKALIVTSDRLHRCGHDLSNYEITEVDGRLRFYDPLDNNMKAKISFSDDVSLHLLSSSTHPNSNSLSQVEYKDSLLFNFAFMLQTEGSLYDAILEYKRLITYFPESLLRNQSFLNIFDCYFINKDYSSAVKWGKYIIDNNECISNINQIRFNIGVAYFKLENYRLSKLMFNSINSNQNRYAEKANMLISLSYAYQLDWTKSIEEFSSIDTNSEFYSNAQDCINKCKEGKTIPYKNQTFAGILALMPGLGYLYDGYPKTALSSFIVNGLFFWGTYKAFEQDNYGLGALLGIFSFGWYSGNVYGSVTSAKRKNIKLENDLLLKFDLGFKF